MKAEVDLLQEQEVHQRVGSTRWSTNEEDRLVEAYQRHGVANFEAIKRDPKYNSLVSARGRAGLHNKWKELTSGGLDLQDVVEARQSQRTFRGPRDQSSSESPLIRELKLKARVARHRQRTARREDELARQRRKRFAAEKRAAAELRKTRAMQDALEQLEREMNPATHVPPARATRRSRGLSKADPHSHSYSGLSPLRASGRHVMGQSASRGLLRGPAIATVHPQAVLPSRGGHRRGVAGGQGARDHVQGISQQMF